MVCKGGSRALTKQKRDRQLRDGDMETNNPLRRVIDRMRATFEMRATSETHRAPSKSGHARGLLLVGLFKLSKAVFFTAVGAGALHLVNKNVEAVLMHVIDALRIDPERRFVTVLLDHAGMIDTHALRRASLLSFLYAVVCVVEGGGLVLEKPWAEYFTVILTALGLPWESYELLERYSPYKVGLLLINLVVLLYLLWILKKRREVASVEEDTGE
jgi:uncharacterized membrane protein (DUF2068 family)